MTFVGLATLMYFIQLLHSIEELATGFHKKWFFRKLSFRFFLGFEIVHNLFWGLVIFLPSFPLKDFLLGLFTLLMFANGIEHIVWAMWSKKYVPGLLTAPAHVAIFVFHYLELGY